MLSLVGHHGAAVARDVYGRAKDHGQRGRASELQAHLRAVKPATSHPFKNYKFTKHLEE